MKKSILLAVALILSFSIFSQTLSNQLLGYQEPYTQMQAQATDSAGNIYYAGTFKGALVINNQTIFTSNGGEDVFVVKTNTNGQVVWAKKVGDTGTDLFSSLVFHNGSLYMSMMIYQTTEIEDVSYNVYSSAPTSIILKIDTTSGRINWVRKNSLPFPKLMPSSDILYVYGVQNAVSAGLLYFEESLLENAASTYRAFFLYMDTAGNFKGHKLLTSSPAGPSTHTLINSAPAANNKLIFLFNTTTTQSIQLGSQIINFPIRSNYQLLIKTDTSLLDFQYKILNPNGEGYGYTLWLENTGFTMSEKGDSLFMIIAGSDNTGSYTLDGFNVPVGDQSLLLVMDTNFVTTKVKPLNIQRIGGYVLRVGLSHAAADNNYYYFRGRITGFNNALPVKGITPQTQEVDLVYGLKEKIDFAGPSKSFVIKTRKDLSESKVTWLGDHTPYESPTVTPAFFTHRKGKLYFLHLADNIWNPWVVDTSLNVLSGAMKTNADRGETTNYVKYFSDGGKAIVGLAKGRTALDIDSTNIVSNLAKSDLFFVGMNNNDQVSWYKRLYHSFANFLIQKITTRNEMIYVSFALVGPRNSGANNYIRIDTSIYFITPTPPQMTGFLIFNKTGKFKVLFLPAPFSAAPMFDVFSDGSLAVASVANSTALNLPGKSFTSASGMYVARFDTSGTLLDAVKFSSSANTSLALPTDLITDTLAKSFKILWVSNLSQAPSGNTFSFHNGISAATNYSVTNPQPASTSSKQYLLLTNTSFITMNGSATIGPLNSINRTSAQVNNKVFLLLGKSNLKDSIYFNNNLLIPDSNSNVRFILGMDTDLNYYKHRVLNSKAEIKADFAFTSLKAHNKMLYASGSNFASIKIDTVNVGYAGMTDAITVQFDTNFVAKKVFRMASPYLETMLGCDIYNDSLISFAYTSQGSPTFVSGRVAARNSSVELTDLDENAYIQTVLLKTGVVTSVDEPITIQGFKLFPNPVLANMVTVDLGNTDAGRYHWLLYNTEGRLIESNMLMWNPGQTKQIQFSNRLQAGNYVLVIKTSKQKTVKAVKLTIL
ncbi:T9SS type A sorting domain-containing protein [Lacibacter sediminis]|uniref:T9SS type A sorting domain-containing protein n=1 Tax=Lacibacter sediminis TaxID=2760713 RepID=A0A7G5XGS9_9BACT|nr:T9SS type A sorting domain-containing protein [Lacibacter sediminis]QNA44682.1 T9SS type A sorting domain-containing protein [Lacibacter sediminis]